MFRYLLFFYLFISLACGSRRYYKNPYPATGSELKSCELAEHIDDTIVIRGYYRLATEYSSFTTIEIDSCSQDFNMDIEINDSCSNCLEYLKYFYLLGAVNLHMDLTARGILKKDHESYGHLGSNNAEFSILEIVSFEQYMINYYSKKSSKRVWIPKDTLVNMENRRRLEQH